MKRLWAVAALASSLAAGRVSSAGDGVLPAPIAEDEQRRVRVVEAFTPATIAVFDSSGQGGGSGVIVTPDGYAVTNFHVVAPCGMAMKCGLPDGRLVDAVLVGLDPVGDIAVIKLLGGDDPPARRRSDWPHARWGDSDAVRVGDEAWVAGNPFLLAEDFMPTVTHGLISGVGRYQYPAGSLLEYADCLQTDAAINPGNSGGPLYDGAGRLVGINGRASFEKRGRVNVGVGYAVSANQVRRFLRQLRAGRLVDHGTLGATFRTAGTGRVVIDDVATDSDAYRRGLRYGDEIVSLDGRPIRSANELQNRLATHPAHWRVRLGVRRGDSVKRLVIRLAPRHGSAALEAEVAGQMKSSTLGPPASAVVKRRPGFVNFHFNTQQRDAVLAACRQIGAWPRGGEDTLAGEDPGGAPASVRFTPDRVTLQTERGRFWADTSAPLSDQVAPPGSGGLLIALRLWRRLLAGETAKLRAFGRSPAGPDLKPHDALTIDTRGIRATFYFDPVSGDLVEIESDATGDADDPCMVRFSGRAGDRGRLPGALTASRGGQVTLRLNRLRYSSEASE